MSFCTLEHAKSQTGPTFSDGTFLHWERFMLWKYNFLGKRLAFSNSPDATRNIEHDWSGQFLISRRAGCRLPAKRLVQILDGASKGQRLSVCQAWKPEFLLNTPHVQKLLETVGFSNQWRNTLGFLISKQYGLVPAVPAASWSGWGQDPALQHHTNWRVQTGSPASRCTELHLQTGVWCQTL